MDPMIVRDPMYQQINKRLRLLVGREYTFGQQFPTEREIVQRFAVSRATANKALASLVSEGVLEFRKGIGTFVRQPSISYDLRSLVSFTEKARTAGKTPSTLLLTFGKLKAREVETQIAEKLIVKESDLLWELDRVRAVDGIPVILEHRFVVASHCPKLTRSQAEGSLYQAWTESHRLTIAVVAVGLLETEIPLWWERTLYRADMYEFHSRLGPVQSAKPLRGQFVEQMQPAKK